MQGEGQHSLVICLWGISASRFLTHKVMPAVTSNCRESERLQNITMAEMRLLGLPHDSCVSMGVCRHLVSFPVGFTWYGDLLRTCFFCVLWTRNPLKQHVRACSSKIAVMKPLKCQNISDISPLVSSISDILELHPWHLRSSVLPSPQGLLGCNGWITRTPMIRGLGKAR